MTNDLIWLRYALFLALVLLGAYSFISPVLEALESIDVGDKYVFEIATEWVSSQLIGTVTAAFCGFCVWLLKESKLGYYY